MKKETKEPKAKSSLSLTLGIPSFNPTQKLTEVVPVKVQLACMHVCEEECK